MFRILIITVAFCALLLLAYVTMHKGNAPHVAEPQLTAQEVSPEEIDKSLPTEPKIDAASEKTDDTEKPQIEEAKVETNEILNQFQKEKPKGSEANVDIEKPASTEEKATKKIFSDKNDRSEKWATLEETQKVLTEAGEMLESLLTERRTK